MKKYYIFSLMLAGTCCLHAQVRRAPVQQKSTVQTSSVTYKGTLGHYELRGPVKSCKEIGDDWELNYTFDPNGILTTINRESVHTSPRTYEFNASGRLIRFFPIPGQENIYEKYEYDKVGRLTKTSECDGNYTKQVITDSYNEKGYCIKRSYVAYGPHGGSSVSTCKVLETDQHGNWTKRTWGGDAIERREITYYESVPISASSVRSNAQTNDEVYEIADKNPSFPGGEQELKKFLVSNLTYPKAAREVGIQGRVMVQFVVNADGSLSEIRVFKSVDPALDEEALRVVRQMPRWSPGQKNGKNVRVRFTLPITFRLTGEDGTLNSLTFDSHTKYMRPTTDDVNVRKSPSLNAPKVQLDKYPGALMECEMYPVLSENQGWFQIPEGWVSKTVAKPTINKPITPSMMNNKWCGHVLGPGDGFMWRVYSPIGSAQLAICDCFGTLRLGKLVNNVFVFKYAVPMSIEIDNEHPNRWEIVHDNDEYYYLFMGTTYCKKVTEKSDYDGSISSYWLPDLSKFTDQQLIQIFQGVIKQNKTDYFYLNSELLTGHWVGNIP